MAFYKLKRKRLNLHRLTHNIQVKLNRFYSKCNVRTSPGNICVTLITCYSVPNLHLDIVVVQKKTCSAKKKKKKPYCSINTIQKRQSFTNSTEASLSMWVTMKVEKKVSHPLGPRKKKK